jgi:hypothetical protein
VTWVTVLGQGVILAVAVLGFLSTRRGVTKVHKLVNNQLDRQLTYNQQLAATLTKAGVPVPPQDEPAELPPARGEEGHGFAGMGFSAQFGAEPLSRALTAHRPRTDTYSGLPFWRVIVAGSRQVKFVRCMSKPRTPVNVWWQAAQWQTLRPVPN